MFNERTIFCRVIFSWRYYSSSGSSSASSYCCHHLELKLPLSFPFSSFQPKRRQLPFFQLAGKKPSIFSSSRCNVFVKSSSSTTLIVASLPMLPHNGLNICGRSEPRLTCYPLGRATRPSRNNNMLGTFSQTGSKPERR
jgi:hypothetical protein